MLAGSRVVSRGASGSVRESLAVPRACGVHAEEEQERRDMEAARTKNKKEKEKEEEKK